MGSSQSSRGRRAKTHSARSTRPRSPNAGPDLQPGPSNIQAQRDEALRHHQAASDAQHIGTLNREPLVRPSSPPPSSGSNNPASLRNYNATSVSSDGRRMASGILNVDHNLQAPRSSDPQIILELEKLRNERDDQAAIIRGKCYDSIFSLRRILAGL